MKLNSALSLVALSVISVLQVSSAQAASVYEIVNIEDFDLKGALNGTQNGYGQSINASDEAVGVAKGKSDLTDSDIETQNDSIDRNTGVEPTDSITYSIYSEIVGNNFGFRSLENDANSPWLPRFESVNGSALTDNSVDTYFYDINDAGVRVGAMTAPEQVTPYTGDGDYENWYTRQYEMRGFVKAGADAAETPIVPAYTTYTDDDGVSVDLGGWSVAAKINNNNRIAGYSSTDISSSSDDRVDSCISNSDSVPVDVCVQRYQFVNSDNGIRYITYQTRAFVWDYNNGALSSTELPLGLDPGSSTRIYRAQALGINDNNVVVGRSNVYRNGDEDRLYYDAAFWQQDANGAYQYHWIPVIDDDDVRSSKAVDINDSGIVVGSYVAYVDGYETEKFFTYDINSPDNLPTVPEDFFNGTSNLTSYPKDINNQGQVVGSIETSRESDFDGPRDGFIYDVNTEEFDDVNDLLTCSSKGYEQTDDGWARHQFSVSDSTGANLTYSADIRVVEGNKITEDGTIVGTAFVRKPVYQTDSSGNLVLDDDGNPLFELNGEGQPVTNYLPRMVVLKPTNSGTACDIADDDREDTGVNGNYERKGAAFWMWLLMLPLVWYRRR